MDRPTPPGPTHDPDVLWVTEAVSSDLTHLVTGSVWGDRTLCGAVPAWRDLGGRARSFPRNGCRPCIREAVRRDYLYARVSHNAWVRIGSA